MTIIYELIKRCTNCNCEFVIDSVLSTNTAGTNTFTDGFIGGGIYAESSNLVLCPECDIYLWEEELPIISIKELISLSLFSNKPHATKFIDYRKALKQKPWKNKTQEKYVRLRALVGIQPSLPK